MRTPFAAAALAACLTALAVLPARAGYVLQDISGNGAFPVAIAINGDGAVVGGSYEWGAVVGGPGTAPQRLDGPWGPHPTMGTVEGLDINRHGEVTGTWRVDDLFRGFRYTPGAGTVDLGVDGLWSTRIGDDGAVYGLPSDGPGRPADGVLAVDRSGAVTRTVSPVPLMGLAGRRADGAFVADRHDAAAQRSVAGVLTDGVWRDLLPDAPAYSHAQAFNSQGVVVGSVDTANPGGWYDPHAFAFDPARGLVDLAAAMDGFIPFSIATGVNAHGRVVGYGARTSEWQTFSFIYDLGTERFVDLATALVGADGWSNLYFNDINDAGQIAGWGIFQDQPRAFVLLPTPPVPEAATASMLLAGVGAVVAVARRRRVPA